jgi:hypothetical protein
MNEQEVSIMKPIMTTLGLELYRLSNGAATVAVGSRKQYDDRNVRPARHAAHRQRFATVDEELSRLCPLHRMLISA